MFVVVLADGPADHHSRLEGQTSEHGIENVAADVIKIHIDAFRAFALEAGNHILVFVVDGAIETQLINQELALVGAAGNADHTATLEFGDLPGNAAHRAGGAGNHHGFAGLRLANVEQGEIGGHTGHAQCGQIQRQRGAARVNLVEALGFAEEVILHTQGAVHIITDGKCRVLRSDHLANTEGAHHFTQANRRNIRLGVVHPAAHGRVQGQVFVLHQNLPRAWLAEVGFYITEGFPAGQALRALSEEELAVELGRHGSYSQAGKLL